MEGEAGEVGRGDRSQNKEREMGGLKVAERHPQKEAQRRAGALLAEDKNLPFAFLPALMKADGGAALCTLHLWAGGRRRRRRRGSLTCRCNKDGFHGDSRGWHGDGVIDPQIKHDNEPRFPPLLYSHQLSERSRIPT